MRTTLQNIIVCLKLRFTGVTRDEVGYRDAPHLEIQNPTFAYSVKAILCQGFRDDPRFLTARDKAYKKVVNDTSIFKVTLFTKSVANLLNNIYCNHPPGQEKVSPPLAAGMSGSH